MKKQAKTEGKNNKNEMSENTLINSKKDMRNYWERL